MKFSTCIFTLLIAKIAFTQVPNIEWQRTFNGNDGDHLQDIWQTSDGGYILGGFSRSGISPDKTEASHGMGDYWIIKTNATGITEWQNTIGGTTGDQVYSIQQTSDGGYFVGGYSYSEICEDKSEGNMGVQAKDYWAVKLDALGNIEWENTIGGIGEDYMSYAEETFDGGYILGGWSRSQPSGDIIETNLNIGTKDYWIIKLDNLGNIEWQNLIGGNMDDELYMIEQTEDGGYIIGGESDSDLSGDKTEPSYGEADYWILKLDAGGNIIWQNTIGGEGDDELFSIIQTNDGGYIMGGGSDSEISGDKTEESMGEEDYWIVKINAIGDIEWQNTIGGAGKDIMHSIRQTNDLGYILGGISGSGINGDKTEASRGNHDYWIVKLDNSGIMQWQKTIGGDYIDDLNCIRQTTDGGYILAGDSESGAGGDKAAINYGEEDYWIVKLSAETVVLPIENIPEQTVNINVYPNPVYNQLNIQFTDGLPMQSTVTITDISGRSIFKSAINELNMEINCTDISDGVYFIEINTGRQKVTSKFVKSGL